MQEISTLRLYLLRAAYLLIAVGLAATIWPLLLDPATSPDHMRGVVWSVLGAVSLLAVLGIRYPLKMLPLLLFEITWKSIWVLLIGLPLWSANQLDANTAATLMDCLLVLVLLPLIPWGYVVRHYVRAASDRWRGETRRPMAMSAHQPQGQ